MRTCKNELDVDFIGGQKPLTKEEEAAISLFIKARKQKHAKPKPRKTKPRTTSPTA
jgi:hypothetical protein